MDEYGEVPVNLPKAKKVGVNWIINSSSWVNHIGSSINQTSLGQPPRKHLLATRCMICMICMICILHLSTCATFAPAKPSRRAPNVWKDCCQTKLKTRKPSQRKKSLEYVSTRGCNLESCQWPGHEEKKYSYVIRYWHQRQHGRVASLLFVAQMGQ